MTTKGASLSFSSNEVTIPGGGEVVITVIPTVPALGTSRLPMYSGYIVLNATDGDSLSLPYIGVVGSLFELNPLNRDPVSGTGVQDGTGKWISANQTFTFPKGEVEGAYYYPIPYAALAWKSLLVRVDVIPLDPAVNTTEVLGVQILSSIKYFPIQWNSRGSVFFSFWNGQLSDGNFALERGYKFLFRALSDFGDASKDDDYDLMESLPIFISYTAEKL